MFRQMRFQRSSALPPPSCSGPAAGRASRPPCAAGSSYLRVRCNRRPGLRCLPWAARPTVRALRANPRRPNPTLHADAFLVVASLIRSAATAIIFLRPATDGGRALSAKRSIAGVFPSAETSVFSACTRCQAGLSTPRLVPRMEYRASGHVPNVRRSPPVRVRSRLSRPG